jgi:CIC family chloride channel protein
MRAFHGNTASKLAGYTKTKAPQIRPQTPAALFSRPAAADMFAAMLRAASRSATHLRTNITRLLAHLGFRGDSFLVIIAVLIGMVTAVAAVGFHQLIVGIRNLLYERVGEHHLYRSPLGLILLIAWPALGGLAVGVIAKYVFRTREGHGVVDVMESVIRSSGFIRPISALEKILTSALTIGSGGAVGAEGPIIQIGAAIASGLGQFFNLARAQMPVVIGCGAAAGISAIFNAPMGGMLFALEIILQDFSLRNVTPVVVASVIANVTTKAIFHHFLPGDVQANSIFVFEQLVHVQLDWMQCGNFILLGGLCGLVGVSVTRFLNYTEQRFARLKVPRAVLPGIGGCLLGCTGVLYVLVFGHLLLGQAKPVPFDTYPMPAFYGDGYGFIQTLLTPQYYSTALAGFGVWYCIALLAFLCVAKIFGTCITLSSGGSGGVIAPALFLGAVVGGATGMLMRVIGLFDVSMIHPEAYALVGMAAVLAAIVHAPLASIVILLELTGNPATVLPAMLASVTATGVARLIFRDSVYTLTLRSRGLHVTSSAALLHRLTVEQVFLEPATILQPEQPLQRILELMSQSGDDEFVVADAQGDYLGLIVREDIKTVLMEREAIPLLLADELMRTDIQPVQTTDDLAAAMDAFNRDDVASLPVSTPAMPNKIIGLLSRTALMRRYQKALAES